jgi:hypothetical protein
VSPRSRSVQARFFLGVAKGGGHDGEGGEGKVVDGEGF